MNLKMHNILKIAAGFFFPNRLHNGLLWQLSLKFFHLYLNFSPFCFREKKRSEVAWNILVLYYSYYCLIRPNLHYHSLHTKFCSAVRFSMFYGFSFFYFFKYVWWLFYLVFMSIVGLSLTISIKVFIVFIFS